MTGAVVGSVQYMAPETLAGQVDQRSDIYAFGVVLYEMLTGRAPFQAETPWEILRQHKDSPPPSLRATAADVPPEITTLVLGCLAKDPADRRHAAADIRTILAPYLAKRAAALESPTASRRMLGRSRSLGWRVYWFLTSSYVRMAVTAAIILALSGATAAGVVFASHSAARSRDRQTAPSTSDDAVAAESASEATGTAAALEAGSSIVAVASSSPMVATVTPPPLATPSPTADDRRVAEDQKLHQLGAGLSLDRFEQVLGTPLFTTQRAAYTQSLFQGRDYWVQAVSDQSGSVGLMAITSCDLSFHPRFEGAPPPNYPRLGTVVLNQTRMAQVDAEPASVRYFTSGATANHYYFDEYYFGNPGGYKTYFVGINDACPFVDSDSLSDARLAFVGPDYRDVPYNAADGRISALRNAAVANTYAEMFSDPAILDSFQIGADRILTRTAPSYSGD